MTPATPAPRPDSARLPTSAAGLRRLMAAEREALAAELAAMGAPPAPPPPAPARLLLLGCSATKSPAPGLLPVRERYRGPLWLTLNKADPAGQAAQLVAVSAALGFVGAWQAIPAYEARLTVRSGEALAAEIAAGVPGLNYRARGAAARRRHQLARLAQSALSEIRLAARKAGRPLESIALCGGRAYLPAMRAAVAAGIAAGCIAPSAAVRTINAAIGRMRQQLRTWLAGEAEAPELLGHNGGPALEDASPAVSPVTSPRPVAPDALPARVILAAWHAAQAEAGR